MASPQAENGHVDLANEIVEALAAYRLSGEEWQCLLVVFRKTYGWHKVEDEISLSQFAAMTRLDRSNVARALRNLAEKNIILRTGLGVKSDTSVKSDTRNASKYRFNKDFDSWKAIEKKKRGSVKFDLEAVSDLTHTKETTTKESNTCARSEKSEQAELFESESDRKAKEAQRIKEEAEALLKAKAKYFREWFAYAFEVVNGGLKYVRTPGKEETLSRAIIKNTTSGTVQEAVIRASRYLQTEKQGQTIGGFKYNMNRYFPLEQGETPDEFRKLGIYPPEETSLKDWRPWAEKEK